MRLFIALAIVLIACTPAPKPPDPNEAWRALVAAYPATEGEWAAVVRVLSVARRSGLDAPEVEKFVGDTWPERPEKRKLEWPKALRASVADMERALVDADPKSVIAEAAMAKDLPDLAKVAELVLLAAKSGEDPAVVALITLAEDLRQRGGIVRAQIGGAILRDAAMWSAANAVPVPTLAKIEPQPRDFVAAVAREVIERTRTAERDVVQRAPEGRLTAAHHKLLNELKEFGVERLGKLAEKPDDFGAIEKASHWRDGPDAVDHPLIPLVARDWSNDAQDYQRLIDLLKRWRAGTLKPAR